MRLSKKHPYTDLAVSSFVLYFGHPELIDEILQLINSSETKRQTIRLNDPRSLEYLFNDKSFEQHASKLNKWIAAHNAAERLRCEHMGSCKLRILKAAYGPPAERGVAARVLNTALSIPVSERTAWDWIRKACRYFAEELKID